MYKHLASISGVLYTAITMFSSKYSKNNLILNFGPTIFFKFFFYIFQQVEVFFTMNFYIILL